MKIPALACTCSSMEVQAIIFATFFIYPLKRVKDKIVANWLNKEAFSIINVKNKIRSRVFSLFLAKYSLRILLLSLKIGTSKRF